MPRSLLAVILVLLAPSWTLGVASEPVADVVSLRDGTRVLGELSDTSRRPVVLLVRRDWVREHAPSWARRWEALEKINVARAVAQRRDRLTAWRRDRASAPAVTTGPDRIAAWIDRELSHLRPGADVGSTVLMAVHPGPSDIQKVERHPRAADGLLRQAWLIKSRNPETISAGSLRAELEGRGLDPSRRTVPAVDQLLPPQVETEAVWLTHRGATEVIHDPGLRFLSYQGMIIPDTRTEGPPGLEALPALGGLIGEQPPDALAARLRQVASQGKVGALVTRLEIAPDLSLVAIEVTLWLRQPGDRWAPAGSRTARVRPEDLGPDAGKGLENDPQVTMAFKLMEAVGLHEINPEVKRRALAIGAATQRALGEARTLADTELNAVALPVFTRAVDREKPAAEPGKVDPASPTPPVRP